MNARTSKTLVSGLVLLLLLAAGPVAPEDWERRGNEAFTAGRYDEAARFYGLAEENATQPGRLAFNGGVAHFNLGRYRDAERLFRCSLESNDLNRRDRALYNLGTCLLHGSEGRDATRLAEAIQCFDRCLDLVGADPRVQDEARHNLELAKQLWRAIRTDAPPPESDPATKDGPPEPEPPERSNGSDSSEGDGSDQRNGTARAVPVPGRNEDPRPVATEQKNPGPARGSMSPLTDQEQLRPLPPHEARELLRQAAERIARERRAMQKAVGGEARAFPDW